jgi:type I restriction enzyme S subunit
MNVVSFLENFRAVVDAPTGINQLRTLVYELAFRGLLVESVDDDAGILVDRLIKTSGNSFGDSRSMSSDVSPLHSIPKNWRWVNIGLIGHDWGQQKPQGDFSYIDVSSIDNRKGIIRGDISVLPASRAPSRARKRVRKGTVIYSTVRPYLLNIAIVDKDFHPMPIASTAFAILHPHEGVEARFVYHYLRSPAFVRYVESVQSGIAYPAISDRKFFAGSFPLPPLEEQKRIVAKVDELMRLCDRLEAQQQEREKLLPLLSRANHTRFVAEPTSDNLQALFGMAKYVSPEKLRSTILTLAIQGDLTVGRNVSAIWPTMRLEQLCTLITDGEHATPERTSTGVPLVTAKNVRAGFLDLTVTDWVSDETAAKCWKRCKPEHSDILMVCVGATTGRVCLVENPPEMVLVRSVALIRANQEQVLPQYLELCLLSPVGQAQIWAKVRQNAQPCLYLGKMKEIEFRIPPVSEQLRIVSMFNYAANRVGYLSELRSKLIFIQELFAKAAVAAITSTEFTENERMKPPKTEVVTALKVGKKPKKPDAAPLATILLQTGGGASAKELWKQSDFVEIDAFYRQLKTEMANGWITEPEKAFVREVEAQ